MSTDMAHRIGKLFGNGPTLWVNMQKAIDMWDAEREHWSIATAAICTKTSEEAWANVKS